MTMTFFEDYLAKHRGYLHIKSLCVNFVRHMTIVEYTWGHIIQTEYIDAEGTTTLEVLKSWDARMAVILHRERFGPEFDEMRTYHRDNYYPVGAVVRLLRND